MEIRLQALATIAQTEFADVISAAVIVDAKLRLALFDASFNVVESNLSLDPATAVRQFLSFARAKLAQQS